MFHNKVVNPEFLLPFRVIPQFSTLSDLALSVPIFLNFNSKNIKFGIDRINYLTYNINI